MVRSGVFYSTDTFAAAFPFLSVSGEDPCNAETPILPAMILPPGLGPGGAVTTGGLFLGSQTHALDANCFNLQHIGAVVNATIEQPNYYEAAGAMGGDDASMEKAKRARKAGVVQHEVIYLRCAIEDVEGQDLENAFRSSHEFLHARRFSGVNVLVHCSRGRNRSASLVANHLVSEG